ncbi:GNAT family N-acetyltransferase [Pedobacter rhizosphaerae]|uniref:Acetyltransferase (GNAT) domain-containing protein n=1 Tax=Pedobacter rhizosphaerae TaxID=390241 RepID=A0A1H9UQ56_9SPHI|nr:hypothetical protein [Pedobacter rhizosphaerae]SES11615.1 hypothetical protein SAMN04488023_1333 [Pedobacter rhizosphaerae]
MEFAEDVVFFRLTEETIIKPFLSKDKDLNEFLFQEAKHYQKKLLATTHIIENRSKTLAYISVFNDTRFADESKFVSKNQARKFVLSQLPSQKRHIKSFPAIKIGRLAVCQEEKGFGKLLIGWIMDYAIHCNDTSACKFITVDAYKVSLGFYEKMNFVYLSDKDINQDTRQMYLDLTPYLNTFKKIV